MTEKTEKKQIEIENVEKVVVLTSDQIFAKNDIEKVYVPVPEWGGGVYVRGMSGAERDEFEESLVKGKGRNREVNLRNARAKLVVLCAVDEQGRQIFAKEAYRKLGSKSAKALDRIYAVASELSGVSEEDMDELTKNSEETSFDD